MSLHHIFMIWVLPLLVSSQNTSDVVESTECFSDFLIILLSNTSSVATGGWLSGNTVIISPDRWNASVYTSQCQTIIKGLSPSKLDLYVGLNYEECGLSSATFEVQKLDMFIMFKEMVAKTESSSGSILNQTKFTVACEYHTQFPITSNATSIYSRSYHGNPGNNTGHVGWEDDIFIMRSTLDFADPNLRRWKDADPSNQYTKLLNNDMGIAGNPDIIMNITDVTKSQDYYPMFLGDTVLLNMYIEDTNTSAYSGMIPLQCGILSSPNKSSNYLPFVEAGCPSMGAVKVLKLFHSYVADTPTSYTISFQAFYFGGDDVMFADIYIQCQMRLCINATMENCAPEKQGCQPGLSWTTGDI